MRPWVPLFAVFYFLCAPHRAWTEDCAQCATKPEPVAPAVSQLSQALTPMVVECKTLAGGEKGLRRVIESTLQTGLKCLAKHGPRAEKDAAKLRELLSDPLKPPRFQCSPFKKRGQAIASAESDPSFPSMLLNEDSAELKSQLPAVLFHEMLHWIGQRHSEGADTTYLTELCCFPDGQSNQRKACEMLKQPSLDWRTESYQRDFGRLMEEITREAVATSSAWNAFEASGDARLLMAHALGINDSAALYTAAQWSKFGNTATGIVFGSAALPLLKDDDRKRFEPAYRKMVERHYPTKGEPLLKRDFFEAYGRLVRAIAQKNGEDFASAWTDFRSRRTKTCHTLTDNERDQLSDTADVLGVSALALTLAEPTQSEVVDHWDKPCD